MAVWNWASLAVWLVVGLLDGWLVFAALGLLVSV
jgi:hypothetical protein